MNPKVTIYSLSHPQSVWVYVGMSKRPKERCAHHMIHLRNGNHANIILRMESQHLDPHLWSFTELETCPAEEGLLAENWWINRMAKQHNVANLVTAKRLADVFGKVGRVLTADELQNMRASRRPMTEMNRDKVRALTIERCSKPIINLQTGQIYKNGTEAAQDLGVCYGSIAQCVELPGRSTAGVMLARYSASMDIDETRANFLRARDAMLDSAEAAKKAARNFETSLRKCVEHLETGNIYPSVTSAANWLGAHPSSLVDHLKGRSGSCRGQTFRYTDKKSTEKLTKGMSQTKSKRIYASKAVRNVDTGQVYSSVTAAAKDVGAQIANLSAACNGKVKRCRGYRWAFEVTP